MARLAIVLGMLAHGKSSTVEPGRIIEVVAVGYAIEVRCCSQALNHRSRLVLGVVASIFLVGASVVGGAVEVEGYSRQFI